MKLQAIGHSTELVVYKNARLRECQVKAALGSLQNFDEPAAKSSLACAAAQHHTDPGLPHCPAVCFSLVIIPIACSPHSAH